MEERLLELRNQMNEINRKMTDLFVLRMNLSKEIAIVKQTAGIPIEDTDREKQILEAILSDTPDELKIHSAKFFQGLFTISKEYQQSIKESSSCDMP